ncbi:MAG: septum formation protein Maf [Crocinitomicaceae bacterium]|nr:septum formation protein Maf [Crocinitomicaceae bacterium]
MLPHLSSKKIILASKSPRRQQLLRGLELVFEVRTKNTDESFPPELSGQDIATYLAKAKADAFQSEINENEIYITADTIVWINDHVLNKPESREEAVQMLKNLSNNRHIVYTGVAITSIAQQIIFFDSTEVYFTQLSEEEIICYIDQYKPYDKAGAYGVQELIGYIGIERINGSYYNVMGLPTHKLYDALKAFR